MTRPAASPTTVPPTAAAASSPIFPLLIQFTLGVFVLGRGAPRAGPGWTRQPRLGADPAAFCIAPAKHTLPRRKFSLLSPPFPWIFLRPSPCAPTPLNPHVGSLGGRSTVGSPGILSSTLLMPAGFIFVFLPPGLCTPPLFFTRRIWRHPLAHA